MLSRSLIVRLTCLLNTSLEPCATFIKLVLTNTPLRRVQCSCFSIIMCFYFLTSSTSLQPLHDDIDALGFCLLDIDLYWPYSKSLASPIRTNKGKTDQSQDQSWDINGIRNAYGPLILVRFL